jgi:hypothetical protein
MIRRNDNLDSQPGVSVPGQDERRGGRPLSETARAPELGSAAPPEPMGAPIR